MMDPEMIRLAQEQMSRIPPDELVKMQQQIMSNPELIRMASEGMKNITPEDVRFASEQMRQFRPEDISEMSSRMAHTSPEEMGAMMSRLEAQRSYELQGASILKNKGNQLHAVGKYLEAAENYERAKSNLRGISTPEASKLRIACSLNLMSCYLKTNQYEKAVAEGSEVLQHDARNLKALYRRGQAFKELRKLQLAVADLSKAVEIAPGDETVLEVLRQVKEELDQAGDEVNAEKPNRNGPVIEEISEEEAERLSSMGKNDIIEEQEGGYLQQPRIQSQQGGNVLSSGAFADTLTSLNKNPDLIRNMHTMMSHLNPEQISSLSGGEMTPDMAKFASEMMQQMSPQDLQKMVETTMALQGRNLSTGSQSEVQKSARTSVENNTAQASRALGGRESAGPVTLTPEMQEQLRQQMKDPQMKQMMNAMLKNMTPESMASMSEQMGIKLSPEEARQAQKMMSNLNPDDLDTLMRWANRVQIFSEYVRKVKNFLLGRLGLILAICMLIIAIILHRLGYIGGY